ncbi:hypothetical protein [Paenibacillus polymyxa]|uniref:hypothetical protein n=1 Tax=Paenibacillus polymyxa TaxID=1406 RepID=UPI00287FECB1|nr:hypothetical protein [Paenibacillus polymyxa]
MSRTIGYVTFSDSTKYYFKYDGTADICNRNLYVNENEPWNIEEPKICQCNNSEEVVIQANYGGGFWWEGKACRACMCITEGTDPYDETVTMHDGYEERSI